LYNFQSSPTEVKKSDVAASGGQQEEPQKSLSEDLSAMTFADAKPEVPTTEGDAKPEMAGSEDVKPETDAADEAQPEADAAEDVEPEMDPSEEAQPETVPSDEAKPETSKSEDKKSSKSPTSTSFRDSRPGTTKRRQYYYKQIADCLSVDRGDRFHLYSLKLKLSCAIPDDQNTRGRSIFDPVSGTA
jgi:hypothetical protein